MRTNIVDDMGMEIGQEKTLKVLEVLGDLAYFEATLVLEMARETIRTKWLAEVSREAKEKGEY